MDVQGLVCQLPHEFTSLKSLAIVLKMDRSGCRKWIASLGISGTRRRMPDSNNQEALAFDHQQVEHILSARKALGHTMAFPDDLSQE